MIIGMLLEMMGIGLIVPAIVLMTKPDLAVNYPWMIPYFMAFGNPSQVTLVIAGVLLLMVIYGIKMMFLAFTGWKQTRFTMRLQIRLSQELFDGYIKMPYVMHLRRNSAELIRNTGSITDQFTGQVITQGMVLVTDGLVLLGISALLIYFEPLGALIVTGSIGLAAWVFNSITRSRITRWGNTRILHDGIRIKTIQEGLGGVKEIKVLGRENIFQERYHASNRQVAIAGQLHQTLQMLPRLWLEMLAVTGVAILVLAMLAQGRSMTRIVPVLGLFTAATFRLMPMVSRVLSAIQSIRYGLPAADTISAELQVIKKGPSEKVLSNSTADKSVSEPLSFNDKVELKGVSFTYPGAAGPVLKNINLVIKKGESVGFIGGSGSGKTTLIDVILGLLEPDSGKILSDGRDINNNLRSWQDHVGYVPQFIFLTDDTLRRNIAFGLPDEKIDETAIARAIRDAQLGELVKSLPEGLNSRVGERGVQLSGGQRQRIGIARALYNDPAILVLDEATSALDNETEKYVMQAITSLKGIKTILIIAHRLSTLENTDVVYRLENGSIKQLNK